MIHLPIYVLNVPVMCLACFLIKSSKPTGSLLGFYSCLKSTKVCPNSSHMFCHQCISVPCFVESSKVTQTASSCTSAKRRYFLWAKHKVDVRSWPTPFDSEKLLKIFGRGKKHEPGGTSKPRGRGDTIGQLHFENRLKVGQGFRTENECDPGTP